jgi:2',3'-cyclic-nucleotide 2'-phosphodiesterase (5'-nucleotidase family)
MGSRFAALAALLVCIAPAVPAQGIPVDIVVVSTTDVHGRIRGWDYYADTAEMQRGLARAASIVDSVRAANPGRVILVDAGDLLQGNPFTYAAAKFDTIGTHGVIAAMNVMRYDAAAVGNHEFNYGFKNLARALPQATFPFLAANAMPLDGHPLWRAYTIVERSGMQIAIVGVTTPGSMIWDRENLAGHASVGDIVAGASDAVAAARREGADAVVVVAHSGFGDDNGEAPMSNGLFENAMGRVAREVPGIDLIVYGHSHREVAATVVNGVLLTQSRNWATSVSIAHLQFEIRGSEWRPIGKGASIVRVEGHAESPAVVAAAERTHAAARRYAATVIGRTRSEWRADSARLTDTPLMDFVLETMRRSAHTDLASAAAFDLGAKIPAGDVTVAQLAKLYPYENTLRAVRITGAQLREYLEQSAKYFRVADGVLGYDPAIPGFNYEMITGARYTIDVAKPVGARITALSVRGRRVRPTDTFTMALTNYRAGGTGGYSMIRGASVVYDRDQDIRQLLIDEVTRRGTISPNDYFTKNWRLTGLPSAGAISTPRPQ